jgi:hypothetical protein
MLPVAVNLCRRHAEWQAEHGVPFGFGKGSLCTERAAAWLCSSEAARRFGGKGNRGSGPQLAGDAPDPERLVHARRAAEMDMMLSHICEARVNLINAHLTNRKLVISPDGTQPHGSAAAAPLEGDSAPQQGARCTDGFAEVEALLEVLPELLRLERYEACALAGRRRALLLLNR